MTTPTPVFRQSMAPLGLAVVVIAVLGLAVSGPAGFARAQSGGQYPSGYGTQAYTPRDFRLPEGAGCTGDIARWEAVQANDYASGNVNLRVYNQIQGEISQAVQACSAGQDARARTLIAASKARHGYPQ